MIAQCNNRKTMVSVCLKLQLPHQKNFTPSSPISSAFRFISNVFSDLTKTSISSPWKSEKFMKNVHLKTLRKNKAFQSNDRCPLSDSLCLIVKGLNMSGGGVGEAGPGPCTEGPCTATSPSSTLNRQTDRTENGKMFSR